jgi:uncharacterized protein (TIGR02996 family)
VDENSYLLSLEQNPDNADLRLAYLAWLETRNDPRAECVRLMNERTRLENDLQQINHRIIEIDRQIEQRFSRGTQDWLDVMYPISSRSPISGRFYISRTPDANPFVSVGDLVAPETTVGIVEVGQLFTFVKAGVQGIISAVLVANETEVEHNQLLFNVRRPPRLIARG